MERLLKWLDGPALVTWLDERGLKTLAEQGTRRNRKALTRWEEGEAASVYTLDKILTEIRAGSPRILFELPDDLWRDPPDFRAGYAHRELAA